MRKSCLILVLVLLSFSLYSKTDKGLVHDSTYYFTWSAVQNEWLDSAKQIFIYDEQQNLVEETSYLWSQESGRWLFAGGLRKELTYDADLNIISEINSTCDSENGYWVHESKKNLVYDDQGRLIERSNYIWNGDSLEWVGDNSKFLQKWTYDLNGDPIHHEYYSWNFITKDWEVFSKFEWRYDESRRITEKIQYKWDPGCQGWTGVMRHTWDYNSIDKTTGIIQYGWFPSLSVWIPKSLRLSRYDLYGRLIRYTEFLWNYHLMKWECHGNSYTCEYDSKGNLTERFDYFWDKGKNTWLPLRHYTTSYDENGNPTEIKYHYWDPVSRTWKLDTDIDRKVTTYDDSGNPIIIMHYQWDPADSAWCRDGMENLVYDPDGKRIEWARYGWDSISGDWIGRCKQCINVANDPCFIELEMCGRITSNTQVLASENTWEEINTEIHYNWNTENSTWFYATKKEQYWSKYRKVVSHNAVLKTGKCKIFPNPFSEYAVISLPESAVTRRIELFDMYGRMIRLENSPRSGLFRLERKDLPGGTYVIRIHADHIYTSRIIIR
jgi:hypothetical protein